MLLAGGLGQQGMGSAAGAVAGYGGRLCGQGAAEYAAGGARAAVINDRELRSECGEQESGCRCPATANAPMTTAHGYAKADKAKRLWGPRKG